MIARIWLMTIIRANTRFALQRITMIPWMGFGITIASSKTNAGEMVRDGPPASGGHSPQRVQPHFAVHQVSEQALLLPRAYRHETRARLAMVGARRAVPVHERRMERRWCSSRNRLSTPLIPRSWGRNTNPGDTPDPGRKNPAPLLRQAPESRALLQVQNGSLGWWLGQETPGPPRSCITHCQRAEHDGMLVEHTVLWD